MRLYAIFKTTRLERTQVEHDEAHRHHRGSEDVEVARRKAQLSAHPQRPLNLCAELNRHHLQLRIHLAVFLTAFALLCLSPFVSTAQTAETPAPARDAGQRRVNPGLPTLFVVGDSTANNNADGAQGWGDPFISYFDASKINVLNRARAGRSSRTFLNEGLWDKVLQEMKPGDFVLIQFGHNDGGPLDTGRARGSLPGLGEETREVSMPDGRKEVVHTFGWYMRRFIADATRKGATPIVLSLTVRNIWKDGHVERGAGSFREWVAAIARSESVEFLDLTTIVADRYEASGEEKVKALFGPDHTHTSPAGAELNAAAVVAGLKGLNGNPLRNYFSARAGAVAAYKTAKAK
jgi:rhamnogalacturonan acetylesterase